MYLYNKTKTHHYAKLDLSYFDQYMFRANTLLCLDLREGDVESWEDFKEYYNIYKYTYLFNRYQKKKVLSVNLLYDKSKHPDYIEYIVGIYSNLIKHIKEKALIIPFINIFSQIPEKNHRAFYLYLLSNLEDFCVLCRIILYGYFSKESNKLRATPAIVDFKISLAFKYFLLAFNNHISTCIEVESLDTPDEDITTDHQGYMPIESLYDLETTYEKVILDREIEKLDRLYRHQASVLMPLTRK